MHSSQLCTSSNLPALASDEDSRMEVKLGSKSVVPRRTIFSKGSTPDRSSRDASARWVEHIGVFVHFSTGGLRLAVTIKIQQEEKEKLDRFIASLLLQEGIKITLQEAVSLPIDYGLENYDELFKRLKEVPPLNQDPAWKGLETPVHWGIKDSSRRIDEFLYGR
jgi:hypothetical protein